MVANMDTASRGRKFKLVTEGNAEIRIFRNGELIRKVDAGYIAGDSFYLIVSDETYKEIVFVEFPEEVSEGEYTFNFDGYQDSGPHPSFIRHEYDSKRFYMSGVCHLIASNAGREQKFQADATYEDGSDVMRVVMMGEVSRVFS